MGRFLRRSIPSVDSPHERELAERLERSMAGATAAPEARPLTIHASPFFLEMAAYLKAAAGSPAWSRRLVRIQRLGDELRERLLAARSEYGMRFAGRPEELTTAWRRYVAEVDLSEMNEMIDKHNLYYPIEAGLRMQWPSGRYILPEGMQFPLPRLTAETLLAEFPADPI